ncbi:hypothetical protein [Bacillus taeanensis]|uniref:hypothetical protein n=1 Tax=Bacillus taeanensis TaxID=273032 RepID=UPI0015F065D3|nr:hypothetical protein [Bacillus taeanensis]
MLESTQQYYELLTDLCFLEDAMTEPTFTKEYQRNTWLEENKRTAHAEIAV